MGAFLFRVGPSNKPAESRGFYGRQLSLDDLLEHLERRGRLGIEPRSIGAVAVDIDDGNADRLLQNFRPLSVYRSRTPGRVHAYYSHDAGRVSPQPFDARRCCKHPGPWRHLKEQVMQVALYYSQTRFRQGGGFL